MPNPNHDLSGRSFLAKILSQRLVPLASLVMLAGSSSIAAAQGGSSSTPASSAGPYEVNVSGSGSRSAPSQPQVKYYKLPRPQPTIGPGSPTPYDWIYKTDMSPAVRESLSRDYQELHQLLQEAGRNAAAELGQNLQDMGGAVAAPRTTDPSADLPTALSVQDRWDRILSLRDEIQQAISQNNLSDAVSPDMLQQSLGLDAQAPDGPGDTAQRLKELRREAAQADQELNQAQAEFEVQQSGGTYRGAPLPDQGLPVTGESPKNYICQTGPCTLEQWQQSGTQSPKTQQGGLQVQGPCQGNPQLGGYSPQPCSGSNARRAPAHQGAPVPQPATANSQGSQNAQVPGLCLNPAAVAANKKSTQDIANGNFAAAAADIRNPDGSYIAWYVPCSQVKK